MQETFRVERRVEVANFVLAVGKKTEQTVLCSDVLMQYSPACTFYYPFPCSVPYTSSQKANTPFFYLSMRAPYYGLGATSKSFFGTEEGFSWLWS